MDCSLHGPLLSVVGYVPVFTESVCLSADCVMAAASILTSADLTVNPCQDFYQAQQQLILYKIFL
jgi:hypothetical protein